MTSDNSYRILRIVKDKAEIVKMRAESSLNADIIVENGRLMQSGTWCGCLVTFYFSLITDEEQMRDDEWVKHILYVEVEE